MSKIEQVEFVGKPTVFRLADVGDRARPWKTLLRMDYSEDRRLALRSLFLTLEGLAVPLAGAFIRGLVPALQSAIMRQEFVWMAGLAGILTILLGGHGKKISAYFSGRERSPQRTWRSALGALGTSAVVFGLLEFVFLATHGLNRDGATFILLWSILALFMLTAERYWTLRYAHGMRVAGQLTERLAIVGAGSATDQLIAHLELVKRNQLEIVGIFDDRKSRIEAFRNRPTGTINDLVQIGQANLIDRILIALPDTAESRILDTVRRLKSLAGDITLLPNIADWRWPEASTDILEGHAYFSLARRPIAKWNAILKRTEDLVLGAFLLLLCLPIMAVVALAIKLESPGPALFRQRRHGYNNAEFDIFKFRSMRHTLSDPSGAKQASRSDMRVTAIGRIIRRLSLDELPQLLNVIRGDMSLVGPRPLPIGMRTDGLLCGEIAENYAHRHRVKPGITGWAQVNGSRGATHLPEQVQRRVAYDLEYIQNWSILFDLKILWRTVWAVLKCDSAF